MGDDLTCADCDTPVQHSTRFCPGCGIEFVEEDIRKPRRRRRWADTVAGVWALAWRGAAILIGISIAISVLSENGGSEMERCVDHQIEEGRSTEAAIYICE